MAAGEIAARFAVTRPAVSQHLTILKDAGLISERRDGTRRLYRARPEGLVELRAFLTQMWPEALSEFKARAETSARLDPEPTATKPTRPDEHARQRQRRGTQT